ncbi:hypothetical protein ACIA8O_31085 [Kitasatospora sp. NPDC051853]|uniref:hypothetical protein n=1 Tax=Kitasatospora sp. NPDC051853 TaxID=3364058 RepID=UPI0037B58449
MSLSKVHKFLATAAATAALAGAAVVAAPAAQAAGYGCSGSHVWSGTVYALNGSAAGTVHTYYDGTYNCSSFVKSAYYGTPTYTNIAIQNGNDQYWNWSDASIQQYKYWAGPAKVYAPGQCVRERVVEYDPSVNLFVDYYSPWHSCS